MSTILDALEKSKKDAHQPKPADDMDLEKELAYRHLQSKCLSDSKIARHSATKAKAASGDKSGAGGLNAGIVTGISVTVLFLVGTVLAVSIILVKMAGDRQSSMLAEAPAPSPRNIKAVEINQAVLPQAALNETQAEIAPVEAPVIEPPVNVPDTTPEIEAAPQTAAAEAPKWVAEKLDAVEPIAQEPAADSAPVESNALDEIVAEAIIASEPAVAAETPLADELQNALETAQNPQPAAEVVMDFQVAAVEEPVSDWKPENEAGPEFGEVVEKPAPAARKPKTNIIYTKSQKGGPIRSIDDVTINGILYSEDRPLAMVNNRSVTVGDSVRGIKIIDIQMDFVKVDFQGEEYVLYY